MRTKEMREMLRERKERYTHWSLYLIIYCKRLNLGTHTHDLGRLILLCSEI